METRISLKTCFALPGSDSERMPLPEGVGTVGDLINYIGGQIEYSFINPESGQLEEDLEIILNKKEINALALAPVSVLPKFQNRGIGTMLIENAHSIAKELNYELIVLLGHARYYPRFGYDQADKFGIKLPFDVPKENCMVKALTKNGLNGVNGTVVYPKEFNE